MKNTQYIGLILLASLLLTVTTVKLATGFSSEIPIPKELNDLALPPVHPDVDAVEIYDEQFSIDNALGDAVRIENALASFQELTSKAKFAFGEDAIAKIDNTSLEIQTIAFPNWLNTLVGTINKQNYQIKKLEFELAQKQFADLEIERTVLDAKKSDYLQAKQDFQSFWRSLKIVD